MNIMITYAPPTSKKVEHCMMAIVVREHITQVWDVYSISSNLTTILDFESCNQQSILMND